MIQYITYIYIQKERSFFSRVAGDRAVSHIHPCPAASFLSALHQQPNMQSVAVVWLMLRDEKSRVNKGKSKA